MTTALSTRNDGLFTAADIRSQVNLIQEVMKGVMKNNEHYGIIPGCKKPSLWKPGAEKLIVTFRIAPEDPKIEDLSTADSIRYRVTRGGRSILTGVFLGAGVGECSSDEEKYKWRRPVCDEEFDETPDNQKRNVWKRGPNGNYQQKQVRTNPSDVANTILKMADKRAYIAMALLTTAASDIFTQDIEDLPPEVAESVAGEHAPEPFRAPEKKSEAPKESAPSSDGPVISEAQGKRLFAIWKGAGKSNEEVAEYLQDKYGLSSTKEIKRADYEAICAWAEKK